MSVFDMNREEFLKELSERTIPETIFKHAGRIYEYMTDLFGERCMDSLLREWSFQWYCEQTGDDYDNIYNKWLGESV